MSPKSRLDYEDYCAIPADGNRYELVDGRLHVTPSPNPAHQDLVFQLARMLAEHFRARRSVFVSPIDLILTPHDILVPDIVVVGNSAQISDRGIEGAPLLVVEVLSPSTRAHDRTTKARRYAQLGVPHYWIVDGDERRIECYRRQAAEYRLVAPATGDDTLVHPDFPALTVDLAELFS